MIITTRFVNDSYDLEMDVYIVYSGCILSMYIVHTCVCVHVCTHWTVCVCM